MSQFKNCLFNVCDLPLENFRMEKDGRKWKRAACNRQTVLIHLAKFGNADGTSVRPSIKTLMTKTGFSHGKVCYIIDDLKVLGYVETLSKGFKRAGQRGAAVRKIVNPLQSKIEGHTVQDSSLTVQDRILTVQPLLDTTCPTDLSNKPVNQSIKRLDDGFMKATGKALGMGTARPDYERLLREFGEDKVLAMLLGFATDPNHNWAKVTNPARLFLARLDDYQHIEPDKRDKVTRLKAGERLSDQDPFAVEPDPDEPSPEFIEANRGRPF